MRSRQLSTVVWRDIAAILGGLASISSQVWVSVNAGQVSEALCITGTVLLGGPAALNSWSYLRGGSGTTESPSPSPSSSPPPVASSPSSSGGSS